MNLVDKENIVLLQIGKQRRKIPLTFNGRSRGLTEIRPHLIRYDGGECSFAKSGRTIEEHVIQRFVARERRLYEFGQIRLDLILSDVFVQTPRAEAILPAVR